MADFPYQHGAKYATYGVDTSTSLATAVTTGAANTKGSYAQLTASTDFPASGVLLCFTSNANTASRFLVDIAIGGAGSETIIINNVVCRAELSSSINIHMYFPISIPSGVRLSARAQSEDAGVVIRVSATIVGGGFASQSPYSKVITLGADTANSDGKFYQTSGTANNTKSGYQELSASTSAPIKAISVVSIHICATANAGILLDIAVGAAGSEVVIVPNIAYSLDITNQVVPTSTGFFPCSIPAGSRVSYREQISANGAINYTDIIVYALC